jgi:hypothetical protein
MKNEVLTVQVVSAAKAAGLQLLSTESGEKYSGGATAKFTLALASDPNPTTHRTLLLELSEGFEFGRPDLMDGVKQYLAESARRLKNPRPDCYLTLHGLPLSFDHFGWPFHESTSDGAESPLHAKVAASMTVTFRDIVPAPEQPFAEGFIYNAIRKTMDQGQLELVKSGNRQPVPLTTRYYSARQKKFVFNDTTEAQRVEFLAGKLFWLSGVLGGGAPLWLLDPRDAQYLDASAQELRQASEALAADGLLSYADDPEYAIPTSKLMGRREQFEAEVAQTLLFIKPSFNEEMRSGLTNM